MVKLISFIVLTHFFQFNQLKILRQHRLLTFFKLNSVLTAYIKYETLIIIMLKTVVLLNIACSSFLRKKKIFFT